MKTIISFVIGAMIVVGAQYSLWRHSLGTFSESGSYWIRDLYVLKEHVAESITSPKIVVMSGSNAMFGLDSEALSEAIGKPVVNMATHAGLPFDFLVKHTLPHIRAGDVVVAPLEFEYYNRDPNPSRFETLNFESWDPEFATATFTRSVTYFRSSSMLVALRNYLSPIENPPVATLKNAVNAAAINSMRGISLWEQHGYSVESANSYGDIIVDGPNDYERIRNYIASPPRAAFLRKLEAFKKSLETKGATLFLTWPVTSPNWKFDFASAETQKAIADFKGALDEHGLHMNCEASAFSFKTSLFLNTEYHLALEGTELRTAVLATCLTGKPPAINPEEMVRKRRQQAIDYDKTH